MDFEFRVSLKGLHWPFIANISMGEFSWPLPSSLLLSEASFSLQILNYKWLFPHVSLAQRKRVWEWLTFLGAGILSGLSLLCIWMPRKMNLNAQGRATGGFHWLSIFNKMLVHAQTISQQRTGKNGWQKEGRLWRSSSQLPTYSRQQLLLQVGEVTFHKSEFPWWCKNCVCTWLLAISSTIAGNLGEVGSEEEKCFQLPVWSTSVTLGNSWKG